MKFTKKPSIMSEPIFNLWFVLLGAAFMIAMLLSTSMWQYITITMLFLIGSVLTSKSAVAWNNYK